MDRKKLERAGELKAPHLNPSPVPKLPKRSKLKMKVSSLKPLSLGKCMKCMPVSALGADVPLGYAGCCYAKNTGSISSQQLDDRSERIICDQQILRLPQQQ